MSTEPLEDGTRSHCKDLFGPGLRSKPSLMILTTAKDSPTAMHFPREERSGLVILSVS